MKTSEVNRILIYRIGNLGDTICAMPAMVAVRQHFPKSMIYLLTNKETTGNPDTEEILKGNDFIDDIITYDPARLKEICYAKDIFKKLRLLQFDLLIYLSLSEGTYTRLMRDRLFFRLIGCKRHVGFKLPRPTNTSTIKGLRTPVFPQEADRLMTLLIPLGIDPTKVEFRLPIKDNDKKAVDAIWSKYGLKDKNPVVAICPGAKFTVKRWDVSRFAEVAAALKNLFNAKIVLIGGPGDNREGEEILKRVGNSIINLIGKTTYMESAEIISRCNLLISNDCGPAHLAAAASTPVVGIYSSRSFPGLWHPWGNHHTVLRNDTLSCRFCFRTECETKECINSITAEQVVEVCKEYLEINFSHHQ